MSAESPGSSAPDDAPPAAGDNNVAGTDFGPNEWLVDELYQKYQADPGSVDRAWWNFFADYHPKPAEQSHAAVPAPEESASAAVAAAQPAVAPSRAAGSAGPATAAGSRERPWPPIPQDRDRDRAGSCGARSPRPASPASPAPGPAAPGASRPGRPVPATPTAPAGPSGPSAGPTAPDGAGPTEIRLRGAAARTAANMAASLAVPTATSVRAVPAKLLIDNRIVINNHLAAAAAARSRSPTSSATRWSGRWPRCRR